MKLKLTIDIRERDLMVCCRMMIDKHALKDAVILEGSALPIGDIIISDDDAKVDKIIIERKTLNDLSASIKDGRYAEQSFRLNGLNHPNHNIIYLIEGDLTKGSIFKSRIDKQMLYSSIFSINYFKKDLLLNYLLKFFQTLLIFIFVLNFGPQNIFYR